MKKIFILFLFFLNFSFSQINTSFIDNKLFLLEKTPYQLNFGNDEFIYSNNLNLDDTHNLLFNHKFNTTKYDSTLQKNEINKVKFSIVTGSLLGIGIWFHFKQQNAWWKDKRGPFNIRDDWDYACQLDKIGHFYGGMITTKTVMECYYWTGLDRRTSLWIGAACGALWQTYVEVEDGFSKEWGFSPTDFLSDVLGAFYPVAQEYWDPLKAINLKLSYLPSSDLKTGTWKRNRFVKKDTFIDDYQGQMFWLTFNVNYFLPDKYKNYWPEWLQIALGYGLSNWDGDEEYMGRHVTDRELWLSFDYDLEKLPGDGELLRLLKKLFNQFHFPAPAVRLTPSPIWYGLFFAHGL